VDAELDGFSGGGVGLLEAAYFAAHAVDDHAALAVDAHQLLVVLFFEAGFAHDVAGLVLHIARLDLLGADLTNVPAGMGHESIACVAAAMDHEHLKDGKVSAMRFDESNVAGGGFRLDDDGLKAGKRSGCVNLLPDIVRLKPKPVGDSRHELGKQLF